MATVSPALFWIAGVDKKCTWLNDPWLAFTGRLLEQELGNGWVDGVHPDDREECFTIYSESFEARRPFSMQYRLRRHDGEYRWLLDEGRPYSTCDGVFAGFIGSCLDVTRLKLSEEKCQEHRRKLLAGEFQDILDEF